MLFLRGDLEIFQLFIIFLGRKISGVTNKVLIGICGEEKSCLVLRRREAREVLSVVCGRGE